MSNLPKYFMMLVCCIALAACNDSELRDIQEQLKQHEEEIRRLKAMVESVNSSISALQTTVSEMKSGGYITGVVPDNQDGTTVGYWLAFGSGETIYLSTGEEAAPQISVQQSDSDFYWTLNGEFLLDKSGSMIPVKDSPAPMLKVDNDRWSVSTDNAASWTMVERAATASPLIKSIDTSNPNYVLITLSDGTVLQLTTWSAHVALKNLVGQLNNNLASMRIIVDAMERRDYLTSVSPIIENGLMAGWTFTFAQSGSVNVYSTDITISQNGQAIKNEDGIWWISSGPGQPFVQVEAANGDGPYIVGIDTSNEEYVVLTLSDSSTVEIQRYTDTVLYTYLPEEGLSIEVGSKVGFPYFLSGTFADKATVTAFSDGNFVISVKQQSPTSGWIEITCIREFEQGFITILLDDGGKTTTYVIHLTLAETTDAFDTFDMATGFGGYIIPAEGGSRTFGTNLFIAEHLDVDWEQTVLYRKGDRTYVTVIVQPNHNREERYLTCYIPDEGSVLIKQLGNPDATPNPDWSAGNVYFPPEGGDYTIVFSKAVTGISMTGNDWVEKVYFGTQEYNKYRIAILRAAPYDGETDRTVQLTIELEGHESVGIINLYQIARQR